MFLASPSLLHTDSPSLYIDLCLKGGCFPTEIFLESHLIENFICPIDFAVCRDPLIDSCGHTFGKICLTACLKNSNKCPLTNKSYPMLKKFATNFQVKNFLSGLKVKCLNYSLTCSWEGKLEELERHLAHDCGDIKEDCPIEGCQEKIARGELLEHIENSCKFVKMKCLFESQGCQEMMNSKDFPFHLVNHHYEEIFQSVKKFDFLNKEKEIYEKKYNDLLTAFFLVDNQRKNLINELKEENTLLKNRLFNKIKKETNGKKEVSSLINSLEFPNKNENFDKIFKGEVEMKKKTNANSLKRNLTPSRKQMPLKKKSKGEEMCFSCRNVKN